MHLDYNKRLPIYRCFIGIYIAKLVLRACIAYASIQALSVHAQLSSGPSLNVLP